jgi:hypothetical protein
MSTTIRRTNAVTLRSAFKVTEKYIIDNSPTLLSAVAVTGACATAYLTGKATFRAAEIIAEHEETLEKFEKPPYDLDTKAKAKLVWKEYIPPAAVLGGTVVCIVMANSISASRMAALAAAYKVSEKQYNEYRDKVKEMFGEKKDDEVKDAIHADVIARHPMPDDDDFGFTSPGIRQWCFDIYSGRYFKSDMQTIRAIANDINLQMIDDTYVRLTDFYDRLGLPGTKLSGEIGWTIEHPLDLKFSSQIADGNGGVPVLVVDFARVPTNLRDFRYFPGCENPY